MKLFRLTKRKYADDLTGKGASISGGRWNSKTIPMVYCSEHPALAVLEVSVHFNLRILHPDFVMVTYEVSDEILIREIKRETLEEGWDSPLHKVSTQIKGDEFYQLNKEEILKVPSAVSPNSFNYLLHPNSKYILGIRPTEISDFPVSKFQRLKA